MNGYGKALALATMGTGVYLVLRGFYSDGLDAQFRKFGFEPPRGPALSFSDRRAILEICRREAVSSVSANV